MGAGRDSGAGPGAQDSLGPERYESVTFDVLLFAMGLGIGVE